MNYPNRIRYTFIIGMAVFIFFIWVDDIFDIPLCFLDIEGNAPNWIAPIWETFLLVVIIGTCLFMIRRVERRIEYLEGLNVICSHCRRVKLEDRWLPVEQWLTETTDVEFSHGLCNECLKNLYPERYERVMETSELDIKNPDKPLNDCKCQSNHYDR